MKDIKALIMRFVFAGILIAFSVIFSGLDLYGRLSDEDIAKKQEGYYVTVCRS